MNIYPETIDWVKYIFDRLLNNAKTKDEYFIYCGLRNILELALENDCEELEEIYKKLNKKISKTS
jgi:hypothetical protein